MPDSSAERRPGAGAAADPVTRSLPGGDPVLAARFAVPPVPATFVRRARLAERLSAGLHHPLVLVNGPAGAGKTLLVADWAAAAPLPGPVVWLTLERGDDAPGVFWAYLLEALRHRGVPLPDDVADPARAAEVDRALPARLAAHLAGRDTPVVLVLDEFEHVTSPAVAAGLDGLLRHAAGGLRLVLISRDEPLLPLHRYRAAGDIAELRGTDLAFTVDETGVLLSRHGLSLSAPGVRALARRTEGWAAGLRLCALAAESADDPEAYLGAFEAGHSTVADFLLAEVLEAQPPETQDLLLRTSILERTHTGLADALTGRRDAARILGELRHANAFVTPLGHDWYRQHTLFAEILRVHLRARHPGLEQELHLRAAHWLHRGGRLADALEHAAAAGEWELAASWLVDDLALGHLLAGLDAARLNGLFAAMPEEAGGPAVELVRAARALARWDADRGLAHLDRADGPAPAAAGGAAARLGGAFLRVLAARLLGSADMAENAAETAAGLERAVPEERLRAHPELSALLLAELGSAQLWEGRFDAARASLAAAAEVPGGTARAAARHESLGRLALIDLLLGSPGRAEAHAREAVAEAERCGLPPSAHSGVGHLVLAEVAFDRDDLAAARAGLERAAAGAGARHDPLVVVGLSVLRARLLLAGGDTCAALAVLAAAEHPAPADKPSPWARQRIALGQCAAHLAGGDPQAAVRMLSAAGGEGPEQAVAAAQAHLAAGDARAAVTALDAVPAGQLRPPAVAVRALLVRARAASACGDPAAAHRLLAQALAAARPDRLRRPFREAGPWVRRLLQERPALARPHGWLPRDLLAGLPRPDDPAAAPPVVERLSEREHDVLVRVAQMMSTDEIAADLHLSVNTVKTHLKSINRKLCATRRGEAVRRARQLHLL
ncbi:LuxR C-terminal-related transcriptional regulator [Kitasatospora sp. NPDC051914]|uniref:LuxR C-terminal-related transcriptional regulator n=1 Tax=Kitasatospora sp. NPDC051914 TaxID=3154945 RepID=UPI003430D6F8